LFSGRLAVRLSAEGLAQWTEIVLNQSVCSTLICRFGFFRSFRATNGFEVFPVLPL
jgi:hypothetical protein